MTPLQPIFKKAYYLLAFFGGVYVTAVYFATYPAVNRALLYMNWLNPTYFQDVNDVEKFGFLCSFVPVPSATYKHRMLTRKTDAAHQVQPFALQTPDNETLYTWHILPTHLAHQHETLLKQTGTYGPAPDFAATGAFKVLAEDPHARIVVNLHGNAVHIASGWRPATYSSFLAASTPSHPVHVIAFDYRGFGLSTGTPTEEGLITDAATVIDYLTSPPLNIPRDRIAVVGHSLGTAVAAGVVERLTLGQVLGENDDDGRGKEVAAKPFAGVVLFAGFSDLETLVKTYSLFGMFPPFLSPLMQYPRAQKYVLGSLADNWPTAARIARLTGAIPLPRSSKTIDLPPLHLQIIHAKNDAEILWANGFRIFEAATNVTADDANDSVSIMEGTREGFGSVVRDEKSGDGKVRSIIWEKENTSTSAGSNKSSKSRKTRVRWERVRYGGHNGITAHQIATLAVVRVFEGEEGL
ncbi:hypothetical protein KEM56_002231 [Ascosphaera pollenicola]|nr:hypothetical protein KEM56_002231 [Ascosphaera pollenicola]